MSDVTPESIARAKADTAAERERVFKATGIRITDEGVPSKAPYLIHCPRHACKFVGSATTDGGAVRSISAHIVGAHLRAVK